MASAGRPLVICLLMMVLGQKYAQAAEIRASTAVRLQRNGAKRMLLQTIDCRAACGERCSKASRHNMCLRACSTCCSRCKCVPPGPSGNQDLCPCYASLKTDGNRPKCP